MVRIENGGATDPAINLALEEHCLRRPGIGDDLIFLYVNDPSVIVGRSQNPAEEADLRYLEARGIPVIRRISGGGAVYHDRGNLNFSWITRHTPARFLDFARFTRPVVDALGRMGVSVRLDGRHGLVAGARKVSGNAQFSAGGRMVSHGTLLFDTDLAAMSRALDPRAEGITSGSLKSVPSPVANIRGLLPQPLAMDDFVHRIAEAFLGSGGAGTYRPTPADWAAAERLAAEKYRAWEWNHGRSPAFRIQRTVSLGSGRIEVRLSVDKGLIRTAALSGGAKENGRLRDLAGALRGRRYTPRDIRRAVEAADPDGRLDRRGLLWALCGGRPAAPYDLYDPYDPDDPY